MNTFVILMIVTLVGVAALFIALALFVRAIVRELEGSAARRHDSSAPSTISRRFASAFERSKCTRDTFLPQVTQLNQTLTSIRDGLRAIDASLAGTIAHVQRQEQR